MQVDLMDVSNGTDEVSLRPKNWDEYIGQSDIKKNLDVFIQASKKRKEALDHVLLFGPPGLGKTSLANLISTQMEANIKITAAPMIEKSGDLAAMLTNIEEGDVLFIDEIHRLNRSIEEILYPAMEDYRLDIIVGSGAGANSVQIDLPKFTLIGATTRAGMLGGPLKDRFGMSFRLNFYNNNELSIIVEKASNRIKKKISKEASMEIAKRSRGTPRIAINLLKRVRDFADVNSEDEISFERAIFALNELGINEHGFDALDMKLISTIVDGGNKAVGLNTLANLLGEDKDTIEYVIEPFLIANGYIEKTSKGRIAKPKSYDILNLKHSKDSLF